MTIASKMTLFYHNQLTTFDCPICGMRERKLDGLDFGISEMPDQEPSLVCFSCAKHLRPDLIEIRNEAFKFAESGLAQSCVDTEKAIVGWASVPWMRGTTREQAAAPKTAAAPQTTEQWQAEKQSHEYRVGCELLVRELVEAKIKAERLGRLEDLDEGIEDENRQGLSLKEIEMLEFHRDHYCISLSTEGPMGFLV